MATTIVNPAPNNNSDNNGMGFLFGIIILIVVVALFIVYGLPYIRSLSGTSGIQVNVPKNINVNVQQSK